MTSSRRRSHQAGLIVYTDDDNYLKWVYVFSSANRRALTLLHETDAESEMQHVDPPHQPESIWLRLTKRGNQYEFASSTDGETFTAHGQTAWGDGDPKQLGLLAKNGGNPNAKAIDAQFDFFELHAPAPPGVVGRQ